MRTDEMTRREFIRAAAAGATAFAMGGTALTEAAEKGVLKQAFPIPRRRLGKTGIEVPILGYGSHISEAVMKTPGMREAQIRHALENSINFFDIYKGPGPQYEVMSRLLRPVSKDVLISLFMGGKKPMEDLEKALKVFRRDHVDMVRMHGAKEGPAYEAMVKAKEQGKARAIGVAAHSEKDLVAQFEKRKFDFAMIIYNFHEDLAGYPKLMPLVRKQGAGVISMKPLGCGSLVKFAEKARKEKDFKDNPDMSLPHAALRFVFRNPEIAMTIPSMYSMKELKENLQAGFSPKLAAEEETFLKSISAAAGPERCVYKSRFKF